MGVKTVISNRLSVIGKVAPEHEHESEPESEPAHELVIPDMTKSWAGIQICLSFKLFNRDKGDTGDKR